MRRGEPPLLLRLLICFVLTAWAAGDASAAKPSPPVTVEWEQGPYAFPGKTGAFVLVVRSHVSVDEIEVSLQGPPEQVLYRGSLHAGETRRIPVSAIVPGPEGPALTAVAATESWRSGATLSGKTELHSSAPERVGGALQFSAVAAGPMANQSAGHGVESLTRSVTGTVLYRDRVQDPFGFVNDDIADDPMRPIRRAKVEVLRDGGVIGETKTDDNGVFSIQTDNAGGNFSVRVFSRLGNGELGLSVKRATFDPVVYTALSDEVGAEPGTGAVNMGQQLVEPGTGGEAFNILDCALLTLDRAQALGENPPTLTLYWNDQAATGPCPSASCYIGNAIWIRGPAPVGGTSDSDAYDDAVIIHETGHYIADNFSTDDSPGGPHFINDSNQDPRLSWGEGWASLWQSYVRLEDGDPFPSWYIDTTGAMGGQNLFFSFDCEGPSFAVAGSGSELAVQAALWEILDDADTPGTAIPSTDDDPIAALGFQQIWNVVSGYFLGFSQPTLETFWDGWFALNQDHQSDMETAFGNLGAEFFPDTMEPNDSFAGAATYMPEQGAVHNTFYPANDADYFKVELQVGQTIILETLNIVGWADTRLRFYDPDMQLMAENDDRAPGQISSSLGYTAQETGTHFIQVTRVSKNCCSNYVDYGSYDLRLFAAEVNHYSFSSIAGERGVEDARLSVGTAWADFNADDRPDIMLINNPGTDGGSDPADALYRQLSNGSFANAAGASGLTRDGGIAAAPADFDNDGDTDLFLSDHALYLNDGAGHFSDITFSSGVEDRGREFDADWCDYNNDGHLDLFVTNRDVPSVLWRNQGDRTFVDATAASNLTFPQDGGEAYSSAWADYNNDGYSDLFVCFNRFQGHTLFENQGDGTFVDVTETAGLASPDAAVGVVWGEINGDEYIDLYVSSLGLNKLYLNNGDGTFADAAGTYGVAYSEQTNGSAVFDYDLDGDNDLFVVTFTSNGLHENVGPTMARSPSAAQGGFCYAAAPGDFDDDGDADLYVTRADGGNYLLRNETDNESITPQWLKVKLTGSLSNRDGVGAVIRVFSSSGNQVHQVGTGFGWAAGGTLPSLFGIPGGVDSVRVDWSSGAWNVVPHPPVNTVLEIEEDITTPILPPETPVPTAWASPALPNPFSVVTAVRLEMETPQTVSLRVYDVKGTLVRDVFNGRVPSGTQRLAWDGRSAAGGRVPAGIYFLRITAGERQVVRKVVRVQR